MRLKERIRRCSILPLIMVHDVQATFPLMVTSFVGPASQPQPTTSSYRRSVGFWYFHFGASWLSASTPWVRLSCWNICKSPTWYRFKLPSFAWPHLPICKCEMLSKLTIKLTPTRWLYKFVYVYFHCCHTTSLLTFRNRNSISSIHFFWKYMRRPS